MKRVTIKDLARELNTSIGTIDRALHNRQGISEKTRAKILDKVKELGYETNTVARSLSRKKAIKIGCVYPGEYKYFYPDLEAGINAAQKELEDFNVHVVKFRSKHLGYNEEIEYLKQLLDEEVDGVAICPGHYMKINDMIKRITDDGVPVITMATDAPDSKRITCISTNSFNNGQIAGDLMTNFVGYHGKIAVLTGSMEVTDHQEKVRGFMDVVYSYPNSIQVVGVYETFDSDQLAYEAVLNILKEHPDLRGVYINNANNASACKAIVDLGKTDQVIIIGTDLTQDNMPYIRTGTMHACIYQNPFLMGYQSVHSLYEILNDSKMFESHSYIKPDIIMKHNLEYYDCYSK